MPLVNEEGQVRQVWLDLLDLMVLPEQWVLLEQLEEAEVLAGRV